MSVERDRQPVNKPEDPTENQITLTGRYKRTGTGAEVITFVYRMGGGELVVIQNIPADLLPEDERKKAITLAAEKAAERGGKARPSNSAPVYIKYKIRKPGPDDDREMTNKPEDPTEAQRTVMGYLRRSESGNEVFVTVLRLDMFELIFIQNVPQCLYDEKDRVKSRHADDEAPVYVKTKIGRFSPDEQHAAVEDAAARRPAHAAKEPAMSKTERHAH